MSEAALQRQAAAHEPVSDCPLLDGNAVHLYESGGEAMAAIFGATAAAQCSVLMEYYTLEDVHAGGEALGELLLRKRAEGVEVALIYDAIGSGGTPDAFFDRLAKAGVQVLEFRATNPLKRHFNWRFNDRDHRKLLVVDGAVAFLGGVNMSRVYENPPSAGTPRDPNKAFWYDAAIRIEGPAVAEIARLFHHGWARYGGGAMRPAEAGAPPPPAGPETIRVDGSAPREKRQLYYESLHAAIAAARSRVLLATGYFVPTHAEWELLAAAAQRGVDVDLVLAGYTDVPGAMHAARALYGRLMKRGVRIHEIRDGMLHAKVATIDGVWVAIGSSNLDRRSYAYNNEIDAIVLGTSTAARVEAMLRGWMERAETISYEAWRRRSWHEHVGELSARVWERYM